MTKFFKALKWLFIIIVLLFIYFPIVFLSVNSFNESNLIETWDGFGFSHYAYFFNWDNEPIHVVIDTVILAVIVALLSTILATIGSIGIYYTKRRVKNYLLGVNQIPVINADVVTAISFALLVSFLGFDKSTYIPLVIGQMVLCTPFVVLSIIPKLKQTDDSLYEAALDLGASPVKALFSVVIPQILPGILSGFLLALTLSLDDYVIAAYTKPDSFKTISTHIYGLDKNNNVGPQIKAAYWALTALIFLIILVVVTLSNIRVFKHRGDKNEKFHS